MAASSRKTPTTVNFGPSIAENVYADKVNDEVVGLWKHVAAWLTGVGGTANGITAISETSVVSAITTYTRPMAFWLIPNQDNTGGVTINIDATGLKDIQTTMGTSLQAGDLAANRLHLIVYDGTAFRLIAGAGGSGSSNAAPDLILVDEKSPSIAGGSSSGGVGFVTRELNVPRRNVLPGATLLSNEFTLPPGTFYIEWSAPAHDSGQHQTRIQNMTDTSTLEHGSSQRDLDTTSATTNSVGCAVFTITASKTFALQHSFQLSQATSGLGVAANRGTKEVYSMVRVWRVGALPSQVDGIPGGGITMPFILSTSIIDADPGPSTLRLNNSTQNAATEMYVDLLDSNLVDVTGILDSTDISTSPIKGHVRLVKYDDPTRFIVFSYTARTTATGYRKFTIAHIGSSSSSPFTNGDKVILAFGIVGDKGTTGAQGADGGDISWLFDTSVTMADPGSGDIRFNNATIASVTSMAFSANSSASGNPSVLNWELAWDDLGTPTERGILVIRKASAPQNFAIFRVTGTITNNTTWVQFSVTHVASAGSFANTDGLSIGFTPSPAAPGSLVFIASLNLAGVSSVDFVHGTAGVVFDDTYDDYLFSLSSVESSNDAVGVGLRVATAGPTFQLDAGDYQWVFAGANSTPAGSDSSSNADTEIQIVGAVLGNAAGENMTAKVWVSNPESATTFKLFSWSTVINGSDNLMRVFNGGGCYDGASADAGAIVGVRFFVTAGTFQAGTIRMFGLKKA